MSAEMIAIKWFDEPIKQSVMSVFTGVSEFVESFDLIKRYRSAHFKVLIPSVETIKILGMQAPMNLNQLYYPTQVSTDIRRRIYSPEWTKINGATTVTKSPQRPASPDKPAIATKLRTVVPADHYLEANPRTVVLGGPGAGKTTFLKYLALAYSDRTVFSKTNLIESYLPVYIHLPSLPAEHTDILDAASSDVIARTDSNALVFYKRLFESGHIVLLLDSLDEVLAEHRAAIIKAVLAFGKLYPKTRIVITCRTADYRESFEGFSEVEIAPLTKIAVRSIVTEWFSSDPKKATKLIALLDMDSAVASLTETPLLLSLLCIQFNNDLALPKRKTELYRRCVDALLRDWDTSRNFRRDSKYTQLSDDRKETIFENIAGDTSATTIEYEFPIQTLVESLARTIERFGLLTSDAPGILSEIESHHGIIEQCSANSYQFSHGSMHEYFIARHFVQRRLELEVLKKHYDDSSWHTVISFMSAMMPDAGPLLTFLIERSSTTNFKYYPTFGKRLLHLLLLYRCMSMGVAITPKLRSSICDHLVESQVHLIVQLNADAVLPFAARREHGVSQRNFFYKRARPSLDKILVPYRSLMNEISLSPLPEYVDRVLSTGPRALSRTDINKYGRVGLLTCLLCPIADSRPQEFLDLMMKCSHTLLSQNPDHVRAFVVESIEVHQRIYPDLKLNLPG